MTAKTRTVTWADLAQLPISGSASTPQGVPGVKNSAPLRGLAAAWDGLGNVFAVASIVQHPYGLGALRAWLGLSQRELGQALARVLGRPRAYGNDTVAQWESEERREAGGDRTRRGQYAAGADVRRAYRLLAREAVRRISAGRYTLKRCRCRVVLVARCARCAKIYAARPGREICQSCNQRGAWSRNPRPGIRPLW